MDFLTLVIILVLGIVIFILFKQNKKLKKVNEKPSVDISTEIIKLKSVGELNVFKIYSKEIVTKKNSPFSGLWDSVLGWTMTKKQIAVIFEFEIDFIYDLKSKDFKIENLGNNDFKVIMPPCKYKFSITDMKIYDEKNSKFMPFLLPDSLNSLFGPSFDESEKNKLIGEAKDEIKNMSVQIINDLGTKIHNSATDTIKTLAKSFGAGNVSLEFTDKNIEKVDVKDSNIELGNELKQKFIVNKK